MKARELIELCKTHGFEYNIEADIEQVKITYITEEQ
jgi:hypothetical protein